ncbi:MAG: sulfatase-like hydrolase/transferase [Gammaproteobacteria bacterium]|nr:sulfatase-like hydrolase/transferase [Gammaproteobacteria bacterium]
MKNLALVLVVISITAYVGWQNRIELLVWGLPKVRELMDPIPPNVPTAWARGPQTSSLSADERPPNIILILADDMGFNDVSLYNGGAGDGSVLTPNIDALARDGVVFNNGYAANAVCAPSRATIMTGRYSTRFGFEFTPFFKSGATIFQWMQDLEKPALPSFINHERLSAMPEMSQLGMPPEETTIAEVLQTRGYYTAHIGKWHLGGTNGMRPEDQGFNDSLYMRGLFYLPEDHPEVINAKREEDGIERMVWANARYAADFNGGAQFEPEGYLTDYYTNEAVKVINNNRHRPFFLYLAHWGIHNPLQALKEDYDAYAHIDDHALRVYSGMIRALDRGVGRVVQALEENGLTDNTLIIFTSDNGGARDIGLADVNKPYRGFKLSHFEGGTHVPYMAKWPARIPPGSEYDEPIHHVDLFHTFAAAAGAEVPGDRKLDGVDLLPYIRGEVQGAPHDTLFWREGYQQTVLHRGWKLIRTDLPNNKRWLFHLEVDPTERNNLAVELSGRVEVLEALLDAHNAEQADPLWPSVIQSPQLIDKHGGQPYEEGDEYIYWPN